MLSGTVKVKCFDLQKNVRKYLRSILLFSLFSVVFLYHAAFFFVTDQLESMKLYKDLQEDINDPLQTCQLPVYHPFEKNVISYFSNPRPISCRTRSPILTFIDNHGYLRFNINAFDEAGYSVKSLKCFYQEIHRIEGNDCKIRYGEKKLMTGSDKPVQDFVYVVCRRYSWLPSVYSMYHAFAQKNSAIRKFKDDTEVGVAVIGLDSVSRLNFMRQLPKSFHFITNEMNGTVLKGFNKVGENTFPNLVPILTGNRPLAEWPKSTFDNWPFIWNVLKRDNIATMYGEDCTRIMTFSWWGEGFASNPTTHYFKPFWLAVDSSPLAAWSSPMCLGAVPKHKIYLDYLKSFLTSYREHPVFMFSLENEPSHDYLNTVGVVDDDLKKFLLTGYKEDLFNRTILFILSDHGHRFDDFRQTKQGKTEDRMPMVSLILPKWFSQSNPHIVKALEINSKRLTSSFDLYHTFVDIFLRSTARKKKIHNDRKMEKSFDFHKPLTGMSLFQPIPINRTCEEAGIPGMYCICMESSRKLRIDDEITKNSAILLRNYINNEILEGSSKTWEEAFRNHMAPETETFQNAVDFDLNSIKKCAKLTLHVEQSELVMKPDGQRLVHLTFRTYPNEGLFEGSVIWPNGELNNGKIHEDIVRINRYGKQADCLSRILINLLPLIRSMCYCS